MSQQASVPMNEDYFYQKPHHNMFNRVFYSNFMKKYNPLHEWRSYHPYKRVRMAPYFGFVPARHWVDGSIDYTYDKYNGQTLGHFHPHEDKKNKPYMHEEGGNRTYGPYLIAPTYVHVYYPRGCNREIINYKKCVKQHGEPSKCLDQKVNIMEVCPKWVLESLRERKRFMMRATLIDNQTYRRAMEVGSYNRDRSLKDIKVDPKVSPPQVKSDGYWDDDRYNPTVYPSPDHYSNVNYGDKIPYNNMIGGNITELVYSRRREMNKKDYSQYLEFKREEEEAK